MRKVLRYFQVYDNSQTGAFASSSNTIIGYNGSGGFDGFIDNVAIYSGRMMTFSEKELLWDQRRATTQANLSANFPMEDASGSTVEDSIGGLTGTISDGGWQ